MDDRPPLEKDEYEIQFYDSSVREMYKELEHYFLDIGNEAFKNMAKLVKKQLGDAKKEKVDCIEKNYDEISRDLNSQSKKHLGTLQDMMEKKIFHIPDDVVLPEDRCQVLYSGTTINKVDQEFDQCLARFEAVRFMKEAVKDEIQCYKNLFPPTKKLLEDIEKMDEEVKSLQVKPEVVAQLNQIEKLLKN